MSKSVLMWMVCAAACAAWVPGVRGQPKPSTAESARTEAEMKRVPLEGAIPAAKQAYEQLQPLVNAQTFRELGFDSIEQAKTAQLGRPMRVWMVRLDQLRAFSPQTEVDGLLHETNEAFFPVEVDGSARTGLRMRFADGKWRVNSFGASAVTTALAKAARTSAPRAGEALDSQFVVTIPVFHLYFIGFREGNQVMLIPAAADSRFKFEAGHAMPATSVMEEVAAYARQYKTGERMVD